MKTLTLNQWFTTLTEYLPGQTLTRLFDELVSLYHEGATPAQASICCMLSRDATQVDADLPGGTLMALPYEVQANHALALLLLGELNPSED